MQQTTIGLRFLAFWMGWHKLPFFMKPAQIDGIYNYVQLSEAIATAGQPTAAQFAAIRNAHYDLIVNLALPTSTNALPNEREIVEALEMTYVHIPVEWEQPTLQNAIAFFDTLQANLGKRIFVHCAMNMRVSAFMFLYRVLYQGVAEEDAIADLHHIWIPNETWQHFMTSVLQNLRESSDNA
jgi:protein tyrosine phosphatase (PTP) superfamily phosphohydrolase (DUF442 family)